KEGVELVLVAGRNGLQELHEQLRGLHEEYGRRNGDEVGARVIAKIESDGKPTHVVLRIVRCIRVTAAERETGADGYFLCEMRGLRQLRCLGRGGELSG